MQKICSRFFILMTVTILIFIWFADSVTADEDLVRAKIGVLKKSGDRSARAMSEDKLKAGDMIRVYIQSELPSYVYVVHRSENSLTLLKIKKQKINNETVLLPSIQDYYQIDGKSREEIITIICSPNPLDQVAAIADDKLNIQEWMEIEKELVKESRITLGQRLQKPFSLAGNVRKGEIADSFFDQLPISSGKGMLIKTYVFKIEK